MTIPAMAPPLSPLFVVVDTPAAPLAAAAMLVNDGVIKGTVVVAEPVEVTVVATLLVGLNGAALVVGVEGCSNRELLLSAALPLLAAH